MKLKYRLRRIFLPRKHSDLIRNIRDISLQLRFIRREIEKYKELADVFIWHDKTWDEWDRLCYNEKYFESLLEKTKLKAREEDNKRRT